MKILIGVWHPAHVHFFKNAIKELKGKGHEVLVAARKKEATYKLLASYNIDFTPISTHKRTAVGKFKDFFSRWKTTFYFCKKVKPDILLGISDFYFAQIGKLLGIPSLVFTDSEPVLIDPILTYPFASQILTPINFSKPLGKKHTRYNGFHEIAYLHPRYFRADNSIFNYLGISKNEKYALLRFVSWSASHDFGHGGFSLENKKELVKQISKYMRVFISSESKLPDDLDSYKIKIPVHKIHDALNFANLFIGDSQTMATEAAILGTPTIRSNSFVGPNDMSNFIELEEKYKLMYNIKNPNLALEKALVICSQDDVKANWIRKSKEIFTSKVDVTQLILDSISRYT